MYLEKQREKSSKKYNKLKLDPIRWKKYLSKSLEKYYRMKKDPLKYEKYRLKRREYERKKYLKLKTEKPEKYAEKIKKWKKKFKTPNGQFKNYKKNAKTRNREFTLDEQFFIDNWNKNCYYCAEEIDGIGLDRIDSKFGYTKENVALACKKCNFMKNIFSREEFIIQCKKIVKNFKNN